jgi:hypothetical protein
MKDENKFATREDLFRFLIANKDYLEAEKKYNIKTADAFSLVSVDAPEGRKSVACKSEPESPDQLRAREKLHVKAVINTTNLLDSHGDVHIDGLWSKTLKEQKKLYHIQEHQMSFEKIISANVKASTEKMSFKSLGFDFDGETEALVFDSEIEKSRNPFMFEQYARGYVDSHSVGMRYVKMHLCVNSENPDHSMEKDHWDKYIDRVANREEAEQKGYFWAVTEAKIIEGSAVLRGSNFITPTVSVSGNSKSQPSTDTGNNDRDEPSTDTRKESLFEKIGKLKT